MSLKEVSKYIVREYYDNGITNGCLAISLTLYGYCLKKGINVRLVSGFYNYVINIDGEDYKTSSKHIWIEYENEIIDLSIKVAKFHMIRQGLLRDSKFTDESYSSKPLYNLRKTGDEKSMDNWVKNINSMKTDNEKIKQVNKYFFIGRETCPPKVIEIYRSIC